MQLGIRLHDTEELPFEERIAQVHALGFACGHLALAKMKDAQGDRLPSATDALTPGYAMYLRRVFEQNRVDVAVLGCYLNLANPNPEKLRETTQRYIAHLRFASLLGAGMVGTETGAPNAEYKLDANTHSKEALLTFMRNLEPVVERAESYGVSMAIEPVWNHIVYNPDRALEVLKGIRSRNLRIIFDPVNLLCMENADKREEVFADAMDKLGDYIAVVHLKDFVRKDGKLVSIAAGTGEMDYRNILRWLKREKPFIQATLENTVNANAFSSRELIERIYAEE